MPTRKQSLLDYLQRPNPRVTCDGCSKSGGTSLSNNKSWQRPRDITKWDDFNFDALNNFCQSKLKGILKKEFHFEEISADSDDPVYTYCDEDSLEHNVIGHWNYRVINEALKVSQAHLKPVHGSVRMVRGGQVTSPYLAKKYRPDWGCARNLQFNRKSKKKSLLPGDTKTSRSWSSLNVVDGRVKAGKISGCWLHAISQIYTYCLRNGTRYGYLITDTELVVVRVGLSRQFSRSQDIGQPTDDPFERARTEGILEYASIPWTVTDDTAATSDRRLSINLVLFVLHQISSGETDIGYDYGHLRDASWDHPPDEKEVQALYQEVPEEVVEDEMQDINPGNADSQEIQTGAMDVDFDYDNEEPLPGKSQHSLRAQPRSVVNSFDSRASRGRSQTRSVNRSFGAVADAGVKKRTTPKKARGKRAHR